MLAGLIALLSFVAPSPMVIVSWDGAPHWVIERMVEERKLPNLRRLIARGWMADGMQPALPSKTAVTHAALFTGAWGNVNGVSGNSVPMLPKSEHTILESMSGFSSHSLMAEPIYITAAKAGRKVVVLSATQAHPADPHLEDLRKAGVPDDRYVQWSGFESQISPSLVWGESDFQDGRLTTTLAGTPFTFTLKGSEITIRSGRTTDRLRPRPPNDRTDRWSRPFPITQGDLYGNTYFRLFQTQDGWKLYSRKVSGFVGAASEELTRKYVDAYGGFHDDGYSPYARGELGPTLWQGGDGTAERALLETIRLDIEFLKRSFRFALTLDPDLVCTYSLNSDSAGHMWVGLLDPDADVYDAAVAAKLWPYYEEVFRIQDDWLGDMMGVAGPGAAFVIVSDHGMQGNSWSFNVNRVLADAGLCSLDDRGQIDIAKTKACAPRWNFQTVSINTTDRKGGIVAPADKEAVLLAVERALTSVRDPRTGALVVQSVMRPDDVEALGGGGPRGADLYYELKRDYYVSTRDAPSAITANRRP